MKKIIILLTVLFVQCKNHDREKASENYFEIQIQSRIVKINELRVKDSLIINPKQIDNAINKFLLLSKDVENLSASINMSSLFFDTIAVKLQINRADLTDINKNMTPEEIGTALKSNELNLFNQILFRNNKGESLMYTAQ